MGYSIKFTDKNRRKAEKLLLEITTLLEKNNIEYCLEGGTLLGIYRENRLLPWDNDVDLSILNSELINISPFLEDLQLNNYRVKYRHFEQDKLIFNKGDLRIIKIRKKRFWGIFKDNICLEIFVKYSNDTSVYWDVAGKTMACPKIFYNKLTKINFLGKNYSIPLKCDEYLTHKYGDWKIPVKDWNAEKDEKSQYY